MQRVLVGIDPGKSGALVKGDFEGNVISIHKMPDTIQGIIDLLSQKEIDKIILEHVWERPGQKGMFNFGKNYGHIEAICALFHTNTEIISPQKWTKTLGIKHSKGATYKERKDKLKETAKELFPDIKVYKWNSDALLLYKFGLLL